MIGAIFGFNNYTSTQWVSHAYSARGSAGAPAEKASVSAAHRASDLESPVQAVDSASPVTTGASGNLNVALSVHNSADVSEMAVRMRISQPEEAGAAEDLPAQPESAQAASPGEARQAQEPAAGAQQAQAQTAGVQEQGPAAEDAQTLQEEESVQEVQAQEQEERQARLEEMAKLEEEAEAAREAYMESLAQTEEARAQRLEALRQTLAEEDGAENTAAQEEQGGEEQTGSLEIDHTAALMQNYQMTNLLQAQIAARMDGEDTTNYSAALDALLQNGQARVRFASEESAGDPAARQAYQQRTAYSLPSIVA